MPPATTKVTPEHGLARADRTCSGVSLRCPRNAINSHPSPRPPAGHARPSRKPHGHRRPRPPAQQRADRAQAQAAEEIALVRADSRRERDEHRAATDARIAAPEATRTALGIRAERAEADLDTARAEHQRLTEQLDQAETAADTGQQLQPADSLQPRTRRAAARTTSRTKKT